MPPSQETTATLRSTPIQTLQDLGPVPVGLAAALLLLICILFLIGFAKRHQRHAIDRSLLLLIVSAGLAFLFGNIFSSTHAALLFEMQSRSGIDPLSLASDHYLIECERLLFSYIAVFALLATGLLGLFRKSGDHP